MILNEKVISMAEISKRDWKLFREKLPEWQEHYMEKLCREYLEILSSDKKASDRFWELEERIKRDRKDIGVVANVTRSEMTFNLMCLMKEGAITLDDLSEFSEELQEQMKFIADRF